MVIRRKDIDLAVLSLECIGNITIRPTALALKGKHIVNMSWLKVYIYMALKKLGLCVTYMKMIIESKVADRDFNIGMKSSFPFQDAVASLECRKKCFPCVKCNFPIVINRNTKRVKSVVLFGSGGGLVICMHLGRGKPASHSGVKFSFLQLFVLASKG